MNSRFITYELKIHACSEEEDKHYKSAHQVRNRIMVVPSDLVVFCVEHNYGGAYTTMRYAMKKEVNYINLCDVNGF